mgnify:CR=1 FL=1
MRNLQSERRRLRESRRGRGQAIVNNLRADGIPVTWERVAELAGTATVGRPHIGQALVEAGVVGSARRGFRRPVVIAEQVLRPSS